MDSKVINFDEKKREIEKESEILNLQFISSGYVVLNLLKKPSDDEMYFMATYQLEENLTDEKIKEIKTLLTNGFSEALDQIFNDYKENQ